MVVYINAALTVIIANDIVTVPDSDRHGRRLGKRPHPVRHRPSHDHGHHSRYRTPGQRLSHSHHCHRRQAPDRSQQDGDQPGGMRPLYRDRQRALHPLHPGQGGLDLRRQLVSVQRLHDLRLRARCRAHARVDLHQPIPDHRPRHAPQDALDHRQEDPIRHGR